MNRIMRCAKILEILSIIGGSIIISCTLAFLFFGIVPPDTSSFWFYLHPSRSYLFHTRLLACLVDMISLSLLIYGIYCFAQLMRRFQRGELFSLPIIQRFKQLSILALLWTLYAPIRYALLSVIMSWHNGPGHRELSIAFGTSDIVNIIIFNVFILISILLQEGYKLQQERDLTI